jgi:hypothetical protein
MTDLSRMLSPLVILLNLAIESKEFTEKRSV